MAVCEYCHQEMQEELSCIPEPLVLAGGVFLPIPWGQEPGWQAREPCHDCSTPPGGFHHPGCDVEACPCCGGQSISCDCWPDRDDDD